MGLRDRALLGTLAYTGARVGAIARLRRGDLEDQGPQRVLRFREKGGKQREIPVRHDLDRWLGEYLEAAGISEDPKETPLFRSALGKQKQLSPRPLSARRKMTVVLELLRGAVQLRKLKKSDGEHKMSRKAIREEWVSWIWARVVGSLMAVLLLASGSSPLLACDDGIAVPDPENNPGLVADCKILLEIRDELASDIPLDRDWSPKRPITAWSGVYLSDPPLRVSRLLMAEFQLTGSIPAALGQLSHLERLDLIKNQLRGEIPKELGQLSKLTELALYKNQLSGSIPRELGQLSKLRSLWLGENQLSGSIPAALGQLSQLRFLHLPNNQLSGSIPTTLGQLSQLEDFFLANNQLTGNIPVELGRLSQLETLSLYDNQLSGEIPVELGQLLELEYLFLSNNGLTGEIPTEFSQLSRLRRLIIAFNQLSGRVPAALGRLSQLVALNLRFNQLTGEIPTTLGQLSQLEHLRLSDNQLSGNIPATLGRLSNLESLYLHSNRLTGEVPAELGQLSNLRELFLGDNQLTGIIPPALGQLSLLGNLHLHRNQLTGPIPAKLAQLSHVEYLSLSNNRLTGTIPAELGQLSNLRGLYLDNNRLTGVIPEELGQLSKTWVLQLSNNGLVGEIPATLGKITFLSTLNLRNNRLAGTIPSELSQATYLRSLVLSGNQLSGRIPAELGQFPRLVELYLDNNRLTGPIPPELSQLSQLGRLHLQHNQLKGPIPPELGQLSNLKEFSFQGNLLTGSVPSELNHLPDAYVLNLTAIQTATDRIDVTWDDPGDPAAEYQYRLRDETETWTDWVPIEDPETTMRMGDGVTIEWTLTGLPTDVVYDRIEIMVSNAKGHTSATALVIVPLMPVASEPEGSLFVPVILTSAGRNDSFFTSELTLTNRGSEEATLHYTYTARSGGGNGTATDRLAPGRQRIKSDAIGYLQSLGIPIPDSGNRIGTLRVEISGSSEVSVVTRTTTAVPDGRAGLSYPGIAEEEGFQEAVYLCGLRQNRQDRSNVAFQHMGAPGEGSITLKTTVFSGEAGDTSPHDLGEMTLQPRGFHQYSGLLGRLGSPAQGYVKVEKVDGEAPFYAYGVINDNFNSDGSFVFPLTESSLVGRSGQTLPVIIETRTFQSELTLTNFSASDKQVDFSFGTDPAEPGGDTATFSLRLKAGEQSILPNLMSWLRQQGVAGIGPAGRAFVRALFATAAEGDMSGIVIGARTGSPDKRGGQYSLFYNGVPYGSASIESAWIYGLQQNEENRSNLALVNTGEIDDSSITLEITIYDGSGDRQPRTKSVTLGPRRWTQENGILGKFSQGYVQVTKTSGNNPFVTYGVINDGGRPGERSGDGAFLLSQE